MAQYRVYINPAQFLVPFRWNIDTGEGTEMMRADNVTILGPSRTEVDENYDDPNDQKPRAWLMCEGVLTRFEQDLIIS